MIQYFEWNLPNEGNLWAKLQKDAEHLRDIGITAVWIPPACKALVQSDVGYGVYDLYDVGEFDQKGSVRTKYGTKEELISCINKLHECQISVYLDAVMNHKAGADYTEKVMAKEVDPNDRGKEVTDAYEIEAWTGFDFPGRGDVYSNFKWHWYHFTGTDYDNKSKKKAIFKFMGDGKDWDQGVDDENGNYDYLMFADIDFAHPEIIEEMAHWGVWVAKELNLDGFRLDAIKHINDEFIRYFLQEVRKVKGEDFYAVGEYWKDDMESLDAYLADVKYKVDLFDVPLHFNMFQASHGGRDYDLTKILDNTLVRNHPTLAVTFVDNHDSQPGSALQSTIADWFKPAAYALILLMKEGYPCIFYGDYYTEAQEKSIHRGVIHTLLDTRKKYAYGDMVEYFDHPNTIGFVRMGDEEHPGSGVVVLISNGTDGSKKMNVGAHRKGEIWYEVTANIPDTVTIDEEGNAEFPVRGGKVAVWVKQDSDAGQ